MMSNSVFTDTLTPRLSFINSFQLKRTSGLWRDDLLKSTALYVQDKPGILCHPRKPECCQILIVSK